MAKKAKAKKKEKIEISKADISGWRGGLDIDLDFKLSTGEVLRDKLSSHVAETLEREINNQRGLIDNLDKWQKQYLGVKPPKDYPYPNCSNVAIPITSSNVDSIFARQAESIFEKRKVILVEAEQEEFVGLDHEIEEALDHFQRHTLKLRKKLMPILMQACKTGTGIGYLTYESKKHTVMRYATEAERDNGDIKKYKLKGTDSQGVKSVEAVYEGPNVYPVSREDFIISSDAVDIDDAYLVGYRKYFRKPQMELRVKQELFDEDAVDKIVSPDKYDDTKKERVENQDKEIEKTRYEEPYEVWELWLKYDVDEDGEEDDIVIYFHRQSRTILRAIYSPIFYGFRPFFALKGAPVEFAFDGMGICQILEKLQEIVDTLWNQLIDRRTQINAPIALVRRDALPSDFKLKPGSVWFVDSIPQDVIDIFTFPEISPESLNEINQLIGLADRAIGNAPGFMGISTSERPVFKETATLLEEANKKIKMLNANIREGIVEMFYKLIEFFAQFQPTYIYSEQEMPQATEKVPAGKKFVPHTVNFPTENIRDGFKLRLAASSELENQEVRRQKGLNEYMLLSDYMTKLAGMGQMLVNPNVPSDFKKLIIEANNISVRVMKKVLEDFDAVDADVLVLDMARVMDVQKLLQMSIDNHPPQPSPGQPGQQGGQPGQPPTPQGPPEGPGGPPMVPSSPAPAME